MKKRIIFGATMGVMLLSLTGCGGKTLTCTNTQEQTGMTMQAEVKVSFRNDTASDLNMTVKTDIDDDYADRTSQFAKLLEEQYSSYEDSGFDVDVKSTNNTVTLTLGADFAHMTDEEKENLGFDSSDNSYDAVKDSLEDSGFTCR